jgi:hypothetical protein
MRPTVATQPRPAWDGCPAPTPHPRRKAGGSPAARRTRWGAWPTANARAVVARSDPSRAKERHKAAVVLCERCRRTSAIFVMDAPRRSIRVARLCRTGGPPRRGAGASRHAAAAPHRAPLSHRLGRNLPRTGPTFHPSSYHARIVLSAPALADPNAGSFRQKSLLLATSAAMWILKSRRCSINRRSTLQSPVGEAWYEICCASRWLQHLKSIGG